MDFNVKDNELEEMEQSDLEEDFEEDFEIPYDEEDFEDDDDDEDLMEGIEEEVEKVYRSFQEEKNELAELDREQIKLLIYMERQTMKDIAPKLMAAILDAYQEGMQYVKNNYDTD